MWSGGEGGGGVGVRVGMGVRVEKCIYVQYIHA